MSRLDQIRDRLQHATPGPWKWGDDWETLAISQPDENNGDKYADLQLRGADDKEILALRVDHYDPLWDTVDASELTPANRALIAAAPDDLAYLVACVDGLRAALEDIELVAGGPLAAKIRALLLKHEL